MIATGELDTVSRPAGRRNRPAIGGPGRPDGAGGEPLRAPPPETGTASPGLRETVRRPAPARARAPGPGQEASTSAGGDLGQLVAPPGADRRSVSAGAVDRSRTDGRRT